MKKIGAIFCFLAAICLGQLSYAEQETYPIQVRVSVKEPLKLMAQSRGGLPTVYIKNGQFFSIHPAGDENRNMPGGDETCALSYWGDKKISKSIDYSPNEGNAQAWVVKVTSKFVPSYEILQVPMGNGQGAFALGCRSNHPFTNESLKNILGDKIIIEIKQ